MPCARNLSIIERTWAMSTQNTRVDLRSAVEVLTSG